MFLKIPEQFPSVSLKTLLDIYHMMKLFSLSLGEKLAINKLSWLI